MAERRFFSHKAVFTALVVSLLLAVGAAVFLYYAYIQYERVASRHLPPGTTAAFRLDVEKVVLYDPVRRHLLPLANERAQGAPGPGLSRLERIQRATKIELGVDLREFVVGFGPGPRDWVLVAGGRFPREGVLAGLEQVLREEGKRWVRSPDGHALVAPVGVAVGQAGDGSLVVAAHEALLRAALPTTDEHGRLRLPQESPGAFALRGEVLRAAVPPALRLLAPPLGVVEEIQGARGELTLGKEVTLTSIVQLRGATAARFEEQIRVLRAGASGFALLPGAPRGALAAVEGVEVAVESPEAVRVTANWSRAEVDAAAEELARLLRALFGWS